MAALAINPEPLPVTGDCLVCHCTEADPCIVWDQDNLHLDPCDWAIVGVLCTNPKCLDSPLGRELMAEVERSEVIDEDDGCEWEPCEPDEVA